MTVALWIIESINNQSIADEKYLCGRVFDQDIIIKILLSIMLSLHDSFVKGILKNYFKLIANFVLMIE